MGQLARTFGAGDFSLSLLQPGSDGSESTVFDRNVARIASQLAELSDRLTKLGAGAAVETVPVSPDLKQADGSSGACSAGSHAALALNIIKARRARVKYFTAELFADPAWDILLELYQADLRQRRVSTSSLCIAASVPATTALRWITLMSEQGLINRRPDPFDGRRVYVELSEESRGQMHIYFETLQSGPLPVI